MEYVKGCTRCQKCSDIRNAPPEALWSLSSPWPFIWWGIDIQGPFPQTLRQVTYLVVAVDYFTKWL